MGVNGFALLEKCRARSLPAAMLTAHAVNIESLNVAIKLGAVSFLPKEELYRLPELVAEILEELSQGKTHWAKLCFEATDIGTHAAVSVVTNGISDDANGADLEAERLWLQVVRQGDLFGMHYSLDGASWRMVRYFALPLPRQVQVGLVAQSPTGPGTSVDFHSFSVEPRRVADMRAGI